MLTRRFGRTALSMPVFSCGGMRYQHRWSDQPLSEIPKESQENLEATVRRALELDILHIETAHGYGTSERQLGRLLQSVPRDRLLIQTKIAPQSDPKVFLDKFQTSLERLGVQYVDLLALHGINNDETYDWACRQGGCFDAARSLKARRQVRFIGFSTHGPTDVIQRAIRFGDEQPHRGFDYVNLHWYFIFQANWPAIVDATERDMGVFIISPTDKGGMLQSPPAKLERLCAPLSPMLFNDLFCLSHPEVHTLSIGAARPSDFDEHLKTLNLLDHSQQLLPPIRERLATAMQTATGDPDPEALGRDLPDFRATPGGLNLKVMLWLYNLARGWDLEQYAKRRFNMLGNASHWFPGAKPDTLRQLDARQLAEAVQGCRHAREIPQLLNEALTTLGGEQVGRLSRGG